MSRVTFICKNCETETTLIDCGDKPPPNGLCPPCHFFGADWEEDPLKVELVDKMQDAKRQH